MLKNNAPHIKKIWPFYAWAAVLILSGFVSLYYSYLFLNKEPDKILLSACLFFTIWFLATGFGIFGRKKWAFISLQIFIAFSFFGFPVGTFLAAKTNKFIKQNDSKYYFN
jgi:hypothetical protein